ncbi:DMT family transporter [Pikeienuella sp. HZG-20]|uniref:DMT family transporter n=1 Tax=Paludibacillus litoralis TaxID=3133267 RepID=UPI0030EE1EE5
MIDGRAREFALLGLLALIWGSTYFFIGVAIKEIPPLTLIAVRIAIAAAFLLVVLRLQGARLPRDRRTWGRLFIQSTLNASVAWCLLAWGQSHIDSGVAAVLNSTSPLFVFFLTLAITRHEALTAIRLLGALLGIAGVALIVGVETLSGLGVSVAGQLAALTSAAFYAGAAIHGHRLSHLKPTVTAAGTMVCALITVAPVALIVDRPWTLAPSGAAMVAAGALGLVCTGVALMIYFRLIATLGSLGVASQAYLRAGFGVMLGVAFLGERLTLTVALGLAAALLGVALINWRPARLARGAPAGDA